MKTKGKPVGTKAQIKAMKEKEKRIATAIFLTIILLALIFSAYFAYTLLAQPSQGSNQPSLQFKPENTNSQLKAAIVDQLSLTMPNETFREAAAAILVKANYTVDYFSGEKVTVEFYRNLATHGYKILILRVHSATGGHPFLSLFTCELYSQSRYYYEQITEKLCRVFYSAEDAPAYFGILPSFIQLSSNGRFQNSTIVAMGCEGLNNTEMAKAFLMAGAKAYIGWNKAVTASHTDTATLHLLQNLLIEKLTLKEAVEHTMKDVGPDPAFRSQLIYYPLDAGEQTIENKN